MDGIFTTPFLRDYPGNLKVDLYNVSSIYFELHKAIGKGMLLIGTPGDDLSKLLEEIRTEEPEIAKALIAQVDAGKLKGVHVNNEVPDVLKKIVAKKSILKKMNAAFAHNADTLFHNRFEEEKWKDQIIFEGGKPVFVESDLLSGKIEFLFKEMSFPLNKEDEFNWARFLVQYVQPFRNVRILDPYLYVHIRKTGLSGILNSLVKKSKYDINVEIISNLSIDSGRKPGEMLEGVREEINQIKRDGINISLYDHSSASKIFHKRIIWTDFWILLTEHGFDFLKSDTGKSLVDKENTLFLTGKYASNDSIWHQVNNNWGDYIRKSRLILSI